MQSDKAPELDRVLSTFTLTLYGVGVIVGAGIYVLIGRITELAGRAAWLAFFCAALCALPTGLSYAELSSRYPRSAGEAVFAERAFGRPLLSFSVGFLILASGIASTATVSRGFASYFLALVGWEGRTLIVAATFIGLLTALNHRGVRESMWVNIVCTATSVAALLLVIAAALPSFGSVDVLSVSGAAGTGSWGGVLAATGLAFFSFIGFEDICNVAEEARGPERAVPQAILWALGLTTVLYVLVAIAVVSALPLERQPASEVPLLYVADQLVPWLPGGWLGWVALFALTNTALFNLIMVSRVLYGMGQARLLPPAFGRVHPSRKTPTTGVLVAGGLAATFALTGVLQVLAESTNLIILAAFFAVNASLVAIHLKAVPPDGGGWHFRVPTVVPIGGMLVTAFFVSRFSAGAYLRAAALLAIGGALYGLGRRRGRPPA